MPPAMHIPYTLYGGKILQAVEIDRMLHRKLTKIFKQACLTNFEIQRLLRHPENAENLRDIISSRYFSTNELDSLSILWIAILGFYHSSAELLLCSGTVDVNERYGLQETDYRFDINEKSSILHALLLMYPSPENERLIDLVIEHGADLQARDSYGRTALHLAVRRSRRIQLTEMLLKKGVDVNAVDNFGETALLAASGSTESDKLMRMLIEYGADVTVKDRFEQNILHGRVKRGPVVDVKLAKLMIQRGASLALREHYHMYQPIHTAAMRGDKDLVKLFLDYGADVNAQAGERELCPLYLVTKHRGPVKLLKTLLKRGANVNHKTAYYGRTALHEACKHGDNESISLLLSTGADAFVEDRNGKTPFITLLRDRVTENSNIDLLIKLQALRRVCLQPSIELTAADRIIKKYPNLWRYYRNCSKELYRARSTMFIETCTFFDLLTKCQCQIAALMRGSEFESEVWLRNLNLFSIYGDDILQAFGRAHNYFLAVTKRENDLSKAVYDSLSYLVVKRIVNYLMRHQCSPYWNVAGITLRGTGVQYPYSENT